ncbi:MAG: hypothetical protein ACREM3_14455 [Candidatus Rokuibacteriota bacterium]
MKKKGARRRGKDLEVVLLADLAPRKDVKGGAGKLLFGERMEPVTAAESDRAEGDQRPRRKGEEG